MKENQSPPPSPLARPSRSGRAGLAALLLAVGVSVCACTVLTYSGPNGERFARSSLGSSVGIDSLEVEADTNGIRRVRMEGYRNDSNQALTTVTEAAVRAALQAR
jgi:hypothetical protein